MIKGTVTVDREAVVPVTIRGSDGAEVEVQAVIDTGFTGWLTLTIEQIQSLGLAWVGSGSAVLGDGSDRPFDVCEGVVVWLGEDRPVFVHGPSGFSVGA